MSLRSSRGGARTDQTLRATLATDASEDRFPADVAAMKNEFGDVGVWLSADHEECLTPVHAGSVARALLAAADWVDDNRNT